VGTLRDGRAVELRGAAPGDVEALEALRAPDPRPHELAGAHVTVAQLAGTPVPVGYGAWFASGDFVCAVQEELRGKGLGTMLLRNAAREAGANGVQTLSVELPTGAHGLAAMLRDCGLVSFWDLDHPVARVQLVVGAMRPGWATP
jgi:GNAT superfamily N-acetyltransferase